MTRETDQHEQAPAPAAATAQAINAWRSHPFLIGLRPEHLATLAGCATPTEFKPAQVIFHEGETANRFYLILSGRVVLETRHHGAAPTVVDQVGGGETLGWSWLFPPYCWHFTAHAAEPTRAIFFYGTWLRERCDADPAFGYELMKRTAAVAIRRLQVTRQQLIHSGSK